MASITRRGNFWRAQVRLAGNPSVSRTFDSRADAVVWARQAESTLDRNELLPSTEAQRTTLHEALERYAREVVHSREYKQQELSRVQRWQHHPLAKRKLASLRGTDFAAYRDSRRGDGRAENTIRLELALISHLFGTARKEWGMESLQNPIKNIRKPSGSKARDRRLKPGEFETIKAVLQQSGNPWAAAAFELAIETTLRAGMLFQMRWDWINFQTRVMTIPIELREKANKGVPAQVPLSTRAMAILEALPRSINGQVFGCTRAAVTMVWKRTMKKIEIKDLRWHDLRHEGVTQLFQRGLNVMEASSISGHKTFAMLKRYTHIDAQTLVSRLG